MAINRVSSILAADFGSVQTRVVLFDVVDGEYRMVAHAAGRTTLGYPDDDLNVGLRRLLQQITQVTGRQFYNQHGRVITPEDRSRNGVDYFVTTASAGRPIRAIVVGLVPEISITSALRAISGTYIETVAQFHLRDGLSEEDRLNAVMLGRPDLIFIAGGTDGGAFTALKTILDVIELGLKIKAPSQRPPIVYAGNNTLRTHVESTFTELTKVLMSDNIRPGIDDEALDTVQDVLGKAYDEHRENQGVAFSDVSEMSSTGLLPTAQSYGLVADYFAKTRHTNVMAVDMGGAATILAATFNDRTTTQISTTKGLGQSIVTLINDTDEAAIAEWLPYYPLGSEIRNYALNKLARPASIPMSLRDLFMEQALMRVAIRQMVEDGRQTWKGVPTVGSLPAVGLIIIGGGALNGAGHPAYDMMLIADCLQPIGVTDIKADRHGIIPPMGAIARTQADATVQILDGDNLEHLGSLISLEGSANQTGIAAKLTIITDEQTVTYDLKAGELLSLSLPYQFSLTLKINCKRGFRINGKRSMKLTLNGGTAGILIDARGRPLPPPTSVTDRIRLLPHWIASATDDPILELPQDWAIDHNMPSIPEPEAIEKSQKAKQGSIFDPTTEPEGDIFAELDADDEPPEVDLDTLFSDEDDNIDDLRSL
ncbi:MAG: glutamate mutase L [Anaerolineae bacterium]